MDSEKRPLIQPVTPEQLNRETKFSNQVAASVATETVGSLLSGTASPDSLLALIENANRFAEEKSKLSRDPHTPSVACKEGCSWCCYQAVAITALEAFRIAKYITEEMDQDSQLAVNENLRELDKKTRGASISKRSSLQLPCAFLKDGTCTIYPVRPLSCAEFTSFNVHDCERGKEIGFRPGGVIHEKARMMVFYAVQTGLADGLRKALPKADHSPLELTAAVLSALNSQGAAQAWLDGGFVFSSAHFLPGIP